MARQIASPSPVPRGLVVTNGLKICSLMSSGMPQPVSDTSTSRVEPPPWERSATRIVSSPPESMASRAFKHRLRKSCSNYDAFPNTFGDPAEPDPPALDLGLDRGQGCPPRRP